MSPRFCAALLACLVACTAGPGFRVEPSEPIRRTLEPAPSGQSSSLRLVTYNAGLAAGYLPHAVDRVVPVIDALAKLPSDVLCVQEFWLDQHWSALTRALADQLPHTLRPPAEQSGQTCSESELGPVEQCVRSACSGVANVDLPACAVQNCRRLASSLSAPCLGCLSKNPVRPIADIIADCSPRDSESSTTNSYMFGGSYGTGLLTRRPMIEREVYKLRSGQHPRGVLYAKLEHEVTGALHVFCTHLTPGSGDGEKVPQVAAFLEYIAKKAPPGEAAVVLGDLNTGPGHNEPLHARQSALYERFTEAGFQNPYAAEPHVDCTFCFDNPLNGSGSGGLLIDHILVRNIRGILQSERVFDDPVTVRTSKGAVTTALSDHYGLRLTITRPSG